MKWFVESHIVRGDEAPRMMLTWTAKVRIVMVLLLVVCLTAVGYMLMGVGCSR